MLLSSIVAKSRLLPAKTVPLYTFYNSEMLQYNILLSQTCPRNRIFFVVCNPWP